MYPQTNQVNSLLSPRSVRPPHTATHPSFGLPMYVSPVLSHAITCRLMKKLSAWVAFFPLSPARSLQTIIHRMSPKTYIFASRDDRLTSVAERMGLRKIAFFSCGNGNNNNYLRPRSRHPLFCRSVILIHAGSSTNPKLRKEGGRCCRLITARLCCLSNRQLQEPPSRSQPSMNTPVAWNRFEKADRRTQNRVGAGSKKRVYICKLQIVRAYALPARFGDTLA